MEGTKYCSSCSRTKPPGDFIHPRTGKDKKTCAECIMKRSAAAKRTAPIDTTATLQLHTTRLDDHEGRIACVEETLYDYDAAGGPPAPDAPGAGDGTFTKSQLRRQKRKNKKAARAAARAAWAAFLFLRRWRRSWDLVNVPSPAPGASGAGGAPAAS